MSEEGFVVFIVFLLLSPLAFIALDRWHQRRAWRKADERAKRYMQQLYPERGGME